MSITASQCRTPGLGARRSPPAISGAASAGLSGAIAIAARTKASSKVLRLSRPVSESRLFSSISPRRWRWKPSRLAVRRSASASGGAALRSSITPSAPVSVVIGYSVVCGVPGRAPLRCRGVSPCRQSRQAGRASSGGSSHPPVPEGSAPSAALPGAARSAKSPARAVVSQRRMRPLDTSRWIATCWQPSRCCASAHSATSSASMSLKRVRQASWSISSDIVGRPLATVAARATTAGRNAGGPADLSATPHKNLRPDPALRRRPALPLHARRRAWAYWEPSGCALRYSPLGRPCGLMPDVAPARPRSALAARPPNRPSRCRRR